jgi:DNA-binding SARP family transcriptional activator/tetratricopeptide (TPR) repeat protein
MAVEYDILGDLVVRVDGTEAALGPTQRQCVLAALLVDANRVVSLDQIADRVWGESLPASATSTLRSYLSRLRHVLGGSVIERGPLGYKIVVGHGETDLDRYRDAVTAGEYEKAFDLWRGEPFAGLHTVWLDGVRRSLLDENFAARLDYHDVQLAAGGHAAILNGLVELCEVHPADERLHGQLILALYRSGRQAEALDLYEAVRRRLADSLGVDPSPQLRDIHQDILTGPRTPAPVQTRPRQLPPDIRGFVGRESPLAALSGLLDGLDVTQPDFGPIVISAIDGAGGIGKTTLAVHWAHRVKHSFPDGQLYLNLHGYGPSAPLNPQDALETLLMALGVPSDRIPHSLSERSALLRSVLDGQRVLVLLDNAKDSEQVRPLLPGSNSLVLVTSRAQLRGLSVREGASLLTLDLLSPSEALKLLGSVIGDERVHNEHQAAAELVELCARLPLAIRLAAEQAALHPSWPLSRVVRELRAQPNRLAALSFDEDANTDLRAVFAWSYEALKPDAARIFGLLGLFPGNDISAAAAAALAGTSASEVATPLRQLVTANMLAQRDDGRYELHDLLRVFAAREVVRDARDEQAAQERLIGWYIHTADNARGWLTGTAHQLPIPATPPEGITALEFADRRMAVAWYDTERDTLLKLVLDADGPGARRSAILVAQLFWHYFHLRGDYRNLMAAYEAALGYAVELGDEFLEAKCCNGLTLPYRFLKTVTDELRVCNRALHIFEQLGDVYQQSTALLNHSSTYNRAGRHDEAIDSATRARDLSLTLREPILAAMALNNHAESLVGLNRFADALAVAEQAAAEFRAVGELSRLVAGLETIAMVHAASGDHRAAITAYRDALTAAEDTQVSAQLVSLQVDLGRQLLAAGDRDEAATVWRQAYALAIQRQDLLADEIERLLGKL